MVRRKLVVPRRTVHVGNTRIPVQTTVTSRPAVARRWLYTAVWLQGRRLRWGADLTVGLGVQWKPHGKLPSGAVPRLDTLQLCHGNSCLVFQIGRVGAVPNILRRLLAESRVLFAAYNAAYDRRLLRAHHGLEVASIMELRGAAGMCKGNASMVETAPQLLGIRGVRKQRSVATSDWDAKRLSPGQVFHLGAYIRRRRR